jgi:RecA/RadA recombinase
MTKPFDVTKFRKSLTKSIDGLSVGFTDPTDWVSTGNYSLNYLVSGDFKRGVPMGKVTVFAGESGAGKSYICSGNLVRHAQEQGIYVVLIDTENALDEAWLHALGVDTAEDKLLKLNMAMIDDVAKMISTFVKDYREMPEDQRPKVLFVLDSLGMLLTPTDVNQFEGGDLKGDMGRKPKALTALVRNCVNMFGNLNIGLVATNHTYASQDMFDPDDKISGGQGFIYASSIVVAMRKLKLKEDEDGNKVSEVKGIRAACKIMKTRYAKPFESVQVKIPYSTGMSPYSGLVDLCEGKGLLQKDGNSLKVTLKDGTTIKQFRKAWERNEDGCLDKLMDEVMFRDTLSTDTSSVTIDEETGEITTEE